jgi:hypothetical protein
MSNREDFLTKSYPRFLWVARFIRHNGQMIDWLFDATEHIPYVINTVQFDDVNLEELHKIR